MADVNLNALVEGLSGKVGKNLVLRQRGGRTFMASRPKQPQTMSDKQQAQRDNFLQATQYAKSIMLVPEAKTEYEALAHNDEFLTPYTMAVKDFLIKPVISMIDTSAYHGAPGDKILVRIPTNYKAKQVTVSLFAADGSPLEAGMAATAQPTRLEWEYVATQNSAVLPGMKIVAMVQDRPGNENSLEKLLA